MRLIPRLLKAAFDRERWQASTMTIVRGGDAKSQPFSYQAAVRCYASWIYAAAQINAIAVASQPLRLYVRNRGAAQKLWRTRRTDRRVKAYLAGDAAQHPSRYVVAKAAEYGQEYEEVTERHPVLELLGRMNPYTNGFDGTVLRVLYGELTGNAYLHPVIDRARGVPVELWTMPSQYVQIVPGEETFIEGYLYGATREQQRPFKPDEVIHFKRPNPRDLYYGIGKVEAAWGVAMQNEAVHEMDHSFFANKARPDYLVTIKGDASPEELERFQAALENKFQGKGRAGKFIAATAEIDVKPLAFPPKDLGGRDEIVEEIAAVFGVPVSMLKANDPNLASATSGYAMWRETTVLPLLRMDEEQLNQDLLPLFGIEDDAFLAYDNPVKGDERFEFEKLRGLVAGGIITANEARAMEGMEPATDPLADALLVNGQPLGGPAQPPALFSADPPKVPLVPTSPDQLVGPVDLAPDLDEPPAPEVKSVIRPTRKDALADCVSDKIPKLIAEGYPQDQAVAIAYSMCSEGKGLEEAIGKAVEDVDTKPPEAVAENARRALEVRETKPESERGMTDVGIARARDLANRANLSEDTIRRMLAYFERHEVDKQGSTWDEQGKGWQAWNGWGGDEGFAWARRKVEEFDRERGEKSCGCADRFILAAGMKRKDCGTGEGGFKPGNTCGHEEGGGDIQQLVRQSARTEVDRIIRSEFESFSEDDANTIRQEIERGLFDDVSVNPKSLSDIESLSNDRETRVQSFVNKANDLIQRMPSTDPKAASEVVIKTMAKSLSSLSIDGIGADLGTIEENLSFAANVVVSKELSDAMYVDRPSESISFSSGPRTQATLDEMGANGSYSQGSIAIASDLKSSFRERSAVIAHELAHSAHVAKTSKPDRSLELPEKRIAFNNGMEKYGWSSSYEYVAVFSQMISQGHKFDSDAWSLYDKLEGPDIREDFRKARTK